MIIFFAHKQKLQKIILKKSTGDKIISLRIYYYLFKPYVNIFFVLYKYFYTLAI